MSWDHATKNKETRNKHEKTLNDFKSLIPTFGSSFQQISSLEWAKSRD